MQNSINNVFTQILSFLKKYGLFIAPILLSLLFMLLLISSYTQSSYPKGGTSIDTPTPANQQGEDNSSNNSSSDISSPQSSSVQENPEGMQEDERGMSLWTNQSFDENDMEGLNATKTVLADGSIQYTYNSDVPNRPNIIIVKNDINVFQRTPINASSDTPPANDQPDYVAQGSSFWGKNAVTYIYLSKGFAYVGDPPTQRVFEQMIFQPCSLDQFKQYDTDITGNIQKQQ